MAEYISRHEAIRAVQLSYGNYEATRKAIFELPAADVATVRRGKWNKQYSSGLKVEKGYVSSCCDMWNERRSNFCPNCGAKMDGAE